jgi:hypothetical protein
MRSATIRVYRTRAPRTKHLFACWLGSGRRTRLDRAIFARADVRRVNDRFVAYVYTDEEAGSHGGALRSIRVLDVRRARLVTATSEYEGFSSDLPLGEVADLRITDRGIAAWIARNEGTQTVPGKSTCSCPSRSSHKSLTHRRSSTPARWRSGPSRSSGSRTRWHRAPRYQSRRRLGLGLSKRWARPSR